MAARSPDRGSIAARCSTPALALGLLVMLGSVLLQRTLDAYEEVLGLPAAALALPGPS